MTKCDPELLEAHGGRCCCNCKYQIPIHTHPWNRDMMRGPVTVIGGWGCYCMPESGIIFFEEEHSICEMHDWKQHDKSGAVS
jgi:hypothetical protein